MDLKLNLPDDLAKRLGPHEDRLVHILELGLRSLAIEDEDSETEADGLPAAWQTAHGELVRLRKTDSPLPSAEELIAYHRGKLDPAEEEKLLDRLALDAEAARDLLDFIWFDSHQASRADPGSPDTAQALRRFRARLAEVPKTEPTVHPFPIPAAPQKVTLPLSRFRRHRWLGWAAALLLVVGVLWIPWWLGAPADRSSPRYAAVIEVTASRGARPFPVSKDVGEILLILPHVESGSEQGRLRILTANGEVVYDDVLRRSADPWSRLYLRLPAERFGPGTYRIEVSTSAQDTLPELRELQFSIEDPAAP